MFDEKENRQNKLTARVYEKNITENILKPELDSILNDLRALRPVCKDDAQENELNEFITRFSEFNYVLDDFINQKKNDKDEAIQLAKNQKKIVKMIIIHELDGSVHQMVLA